MNTHHATLSHPRYRADIDGLRAVAVLAVVGYHAFPQAIPGGFTGVDVFFVISGFLISTILLDNLQNGTFSFLEFYARRIRRIFPALLVVMAACLSFGWVALLSSEYARMGNHVMAGAGFVANLLLWSESGYFDSEAVTKPLQHLWSLGVEEQFYIVWPLMLWAAWKARLSPLLIIVGILVASFALNVHGIESDRIANFYSPLTRWWELLAGGLLAWVAVNRAAALDRVAARFGCATALAGLAALMAGVALVDDRSAFPGWWALLPVGGAALLILSGANAGAKTCINRVVLGNRVLVWFGTISYPLYLWHWPLLSFARIVQGESPGTTARVAAVIIAIVLAWLTCRLIERPIRFGSTSASSARWKTRVLFLSMLAVGCAGYIISVNDGLPSKPHAAIAAVYEGDTGHLEFHRYIAEQFHPCLPKQIADESLKWDGYVRCAQSKAAADIDFAVIGDSHAEHLFIGLAEALPQHNVAYYIRNTTEPFPGNGRFAAVYEHVLRSRTIRRVVLTLYWDSVSLRAPHDSIMVREILSTADALIRSGKEVYLTDDVPDFPFVPEKCKGKRWPYGAARLSCEAGDVNTAEKPSPAQALLKEVVARDPRIGLLNTRAYFCRDGLCSMLADDKLLYRDFNHLNINGSRYVARRLVQAHPGLAR